MSVDVTIKGAGVFGLSSALALAKRGLKVRVVDPKGIGAGASGGLIGALAPHAPEGWKPLKAFQLKALLSAEAFWTEVAQIGGVEAGYGRLGRLQPIEKESSLAAMRQREENAKTLWQGRAEWRVLPATGADWEPHSPSGYLVHDTLTARISPRRALQALAAALCALGGEIVQEAADEGLILHATGAAGLVELSSQIGRKLGGGQKGQAALLRYDARDLPQIYDSGIYIVPHADGTLAIGSTSENEYEHEEVDQQLHDLIAKARTLLPILVKAEVIELWTSLRPRTKMRGPVLGAWPEKSGHFIANGGFKIGFGLAPLIGEAMADLITKGEMDIPTEMRIEALLA